MKAELCASGADVFHQLVDRGIRRHGGPGSHGQLLIRQSQALPAAVLATALRHLAQQAPLLAARWVGGIRGPRWRFSMSNNADLVAEWGDDLQRLASAHLQQALPAPWLIRFGHAPTGLVVTWDHRLIDARGIMGLLCALPRLALGQRLDETWWRNDYRQPAEVPASHAGRGRLARLLLPLIRPQRLARIWRPERVATAGPYALVDIQLTTAETVLLDERIRATTGRFGETAFVLAALAAALENGNGGGGDLLFPLAADVRATGETRLLSNHHGFSMLLLPSGLATTDLSQAARQLKDAQRAWLAGDGLRAMAASLTYFHYLGGRRGQCEIGNRQAGVWASCLVANTGQTRLPATWFGQPIEAVLHRVTVPERPGLAAIFSRDARGAGVTFMATAAVAAGLSLSGSSLANLATAMRHQLLARPLA